MPSLDKVLTFLLPIISTLVVVLAIVYDGKLVADNNKPLLRKIKPAGYILILFTLFLNLYQSVSSDNTLTETKALARTKEIKDSIRIADLTQLAKENLIKTDENTTIADANLKKTEAIKVQLIDNTLKEFKEQRLAVERQRENIFIHFRNELGLNIAYIFNDLDDTKIKSYDGKEVFINLILKDEYLKKYIAQTNNEQTIRDLLHLNNLIEQTNTTIQILLHSKPNEKTININALLTQKIELYRYFYKTFCIASDCKSYKEYEEFNYNTRFKFFNQETFFKYFTNASTPANFKLVYNTIDYFQKL